MPKRLAPSLPPAARGPARVVRIASAGVLLLALLGSCWLAGRPMADAPPRGSGLPIPARHAVPPPLPDAGPSARTARPRTSAGPAPAPATTPRTPSVSPVVGEVVEVCGWGRVELPADDPFALQRIPAASRRAALDEAQAWMAADADPRVRAAALLVGARGTHGRARIDQLARLAAGSQDAAVYALALLGCRGLAEAGATACALLGPAQAAQLEPDNAQAWLALAADAAARQDAEAEHDAMRHAAQARHVTTHTAALPVLVARALDAPQAALQRTLAVGVALGLQDASRLAPDAGGVAQARGYCLADAPQPDSGPAGANGDTDTSPRATTCRPLARLLLQQGRGVAELGAGLAIARRWGSAPAELSAWQQEHDALLDTAAPLADGNDLGCAAQQRQLAWLQAVASAGERAALRAQLSAAGHSIAEWSARHRRTLALVHATVAAAVEPDGAEPPR